MAYLDENGLKAFFDLLVERGNAEWYDAEEDTFKGVKASYAESANGFYGFRNIKLTGDVTGEKTWSGSGDLSIRTTVADDSHNHVISNIDGLQSALDGKASSSHTHTIANVTNLQSSLDSKLDKSGGTVTGPTTFNSTVTIGSAVLTYNTTEQALVISFN